MSLRGSILWLWGVTAAAVVAGQPAVSAVDLVFYGDTRSGLLQSSADPQHTPGQIHNAVATRIGMLTDLSSERAILFLGDAVSHAGCPELWKERFLPVLKHLTAFTDSAGNYLFYPVIGDHETFLIPESYEEALHSPVQCSIFKELYRVAKQGSGAGALTKKGKGGARLTKSQHSKAVQFQRLPAQVRCPKEEPAACRNPGVEGIQLAECKICDYQRKECQGNCGAYAFREAFTADRGFSAFREAWSKSPAGASWYAKDFTLVAGTGAPSRLRVLFLDTQADKALRAGGETQQEWLTAKVQELNNGDLLILVGHQTPGNRSDLYAPPLETAFERGVRVLAVVAGHYHGFGSGSFRLALKRRGAVDHTGPQEVYFAISGDGGSRDGGSVSGVVASNMVTNNRIGRYLQTTAVPGKEWETDKDRDVASFARMTVTADGLEVTDYRVRIESSPKSPLHVEAPRVENDTPSILTRKRTLRVAAR
jgi:hypothetical protein